MIEPGGAVSPVATIGVTMAAVSPAGASPLGAPDGPVGPGGGPSAPACGWVEPSGWTASPLHSRNEPQVPQKVAPCSFVAPQTLQTIKPALPVVDRRASLTGT